MGIRKLGVFSFTFKNKRLLNEFIRYGILFGIIVFLTACQSTTPASKSSNDSLTYVHFIDVGQADSILVESNGEVLLMDGGNNNDSEKVIDYIKKQGIEKIDYVIGSHPHEDHIGGLDDVIKEFNIGKVFLTDYVLPSVSFENLLASIKQKELQVIIPNAGDEYALGSASFKFVAPVKADYGSKVNNYSIGIKLVDGKNSFLLTADAEEVSEMDMVESGMDITADVLKVNHHGSITSNTEIFIDAVDPTYAVISVGKDNPYGNPSSSVVTRLLDHDVQIYRTDLMGTITVISDGNNLIFKTEKKAGSDTIINVEEDKGNDVESDKSEIIEAEVYVTQSGKKYHIKDCPYLKSSKIEITLGNAKKNGYEPCSKCNPPE